MTALEFSVRRADYSRDLTALRLIRDCVFVQEQNVPLALEWDELDSACFHVLAIDTHQQPIGTGRLTPDQRIGRMAVMPEWRGKGVGDGLLLALIAQARINAWTQVSLHAQKSAMGFYLKHGFLPYGTEYLEAGIVHQSMRLELTTAGN